MIPPPITPGGKKIEGYQCEKTWYIYRKKKKRKRKKKTLNETITQRSLNLFPKEINKGS